MNELGIFALGFFAGGIAIFLTIATGYALAADFIDKLKGDKNGH